MIVTFYDQTHPKASVGRIAGFRTPTPKQKTRKKKGSGSRSNLQKR
jgi:hypothetical protein